MVPTTLDRRWWVMFSISISVYMSTLDAGIVNVALPTVVRVLNTDLQTIAWVVMGYQIIITGCLLLVGRLADVFGQKRVYLAGLFTFTLGSVLCGVSPTIHVLIGSRIIQGLGASSLIVNGTAIIAMVFPEKERGQALGIIGSVVSVGFLTGPLIGGFLVEHVGWRSIFFINLPIGAAAILLTLRVLEEDRPGRRVPLDLLGALLLFFSLISLLLFLNEVPKRSSPLLWGCLSASLLSFALFITAELRTPTPIVDLRLFKRRFFAASMGTSLLIFWITGCHSFIMPFFLQNILEFSPSKAGMFMFPIALAMMIVAPLGGRLSDRVRGGLPATIGMALISLAVFSFCLLDGRASGYLIVWRQVVLGIGLGFFTPANNSTIIGSLPRDKLGIASSFSALSRNLGMVIGVAVAEMLIAFGSQKVPGEAAKGSPSLASLHDVWKLTLLMGVAAIFLSWVMRGRPNNPRS